MVKFSLKKEANGKDVVNRVPSFTSHSSHLSITGVVQLTSPSVEVVSPPAKHPPSDVGTMSLATS